MNDLALDNLRPTLVTGIDNPTEPPLKYAPPQTRAAAAAASNNKPSKIQTTNPLERIGHALKELKWDENEQLAELVEQYKSQEGVSMAKAIQMAANDLKPKEKEDTQSS